MVGHRPDEDRIESRNPRFRHLSPKVEMKAKKSTEHFSHVVVVLLLSLWSYFYLPQNSLDISCSFRVIDHKVHYLQKLTEKLTHYVKL